MIKLNHSFVGNIKFKIQSIKENNFFLFPITFQNPCLLIIISGTKCMILVGFSTKKIANYSCFYYYFCPRSVPIGRTSMTLTLALWHINLELGQHQKQQTSLDQWNSLILSTHIVVKLPYSTMQSISSYWLHTMEGTTG